MKIAIQGIQGSYHHQAALQFFKEKEMEITHFKNFSHVTNAVKNNSCAYGVLAIENSIAGTLLPNYKLITKNQLHVVGEVYLNVQHHLMTNPGVSLNAITEVHSHPMALLQCDEYLEQAHFKKIVETSDTASAAKKIAQQKLNHVAAIASELTSQIYGLEIVKSNIQTIKNNQTRFFILQNKPLENANFDKASIKFIANHKIGSLGQILNVIAQNHINLEKLQSVPIIEQPWNYAFHADLTFDHPNQFTEVIDELKAFTEDLEIIETYKNNKFRVNSTDKHSSLLQQLN